MIKVEASTLEEAFKKASLQLECSVTMLQVEVVQQPAKGFFGFFGKNAIIVATKKVEESLEKVKETVLKPVEKTPKKEGKEAPYQTPLEEVVKESKPSNLKQAISKKSVSEKPVREKTAKQNHANTPTHDFITPTSMVTAQDDYEEVFDENEYDSSKKQKEERPRTKDEIRKNIAQHEAQDDTLKRVDSKSLDSSVVDSFFEATLSTEEVVTQVQTQVNQLFKASCFAIESILVSVHDDKTLLIEFKGDDAALLIGKEGYRYKALSYMIFNWINAKYGFQLRLEIAEFLQNQEAMIKKYLVGISQRVQKDGRAQTKVLDGVLVQIALKELRAMFPDKYVAIRTNRDGLKYIIINSFRNND